MSSPATEQDIGLSTKQVFDLCSSYYLREDRHWTAFDDLATRVVMKKPSPAVLDAGCGPGWHLALLARSNAARRLVGVDFSRHMIEEARKRLAESGLEGSVDLCLADLRNVPFDDALFDVVLCMNNTLGNILGDSVESAEDERIRALGELRRVLAADGGALVLGVYRREALELGGTYGKVFFLDHVLSRFEAGDLVVRYCSPPATPRVGTPYYSHWFREDELEGLLSRTGLAVRSTVVRGASICVVAETAHQ